MRRPAPRRRNNAHANYFRSVNARLRAAIDAGRNAYIRNLAPRAGPFNRAELKYSDGMKRLILKNVQTREAERRKGHLKRLIALLDALALEKGLTATEIQSILSPHVRAMLPWRGFPPIDNYGVSSVKRYRTTSPNAYNSLWR